MSNAVVTGAASGMGLATVQLLCREGWTVLPLDRTDTTVQTDAGPLRTVPVDVTRRADVAAAVAEHVQRHGGIDLVANVAGIYPPSTLSDFTEELYRRTFDVNVLGVLNVIAEAVPHLVAGSAVVNFASLDAFTVSPGQLLYGASKAAVVMLTKELALELAPRGIRVNAIAPGWVAKPGNRVTGRMEAAMSAVPLGRVATPEEIARWVLLPAGSHAGFMTGESIVPSGGDVMR